MDERRRENAIVPSTCSAIATDRYDTVAFGSEIGRCRNEIVEVASEWCEKSRENGVYALHRARGVNRRAKLALTHF